MHGDLNNNADRLALDAWFARQDAAGKRVFYELDEALPPFGFRLERGTLYCGAKLFRHCEQFLLAKGIDPNTRDVRCDGETHCDTETDRQQHSPATDHPCKNQSY